MEILKRRLFKLICPGPACGPPFKRASTLVTGGGFRPSPLTMVKTYRAPGWEATNPSPCSFAGETRERNRSTAWIICSRSHRRFCTLRTFQAPPAAPQCRVQWHRYTLGVLKGIRPGYPLSNRFGRPNVSNKLHDEARKDTAPRNPKQYPSLRPCPCSKNV
jgi:hypothetical protein